MANQPDWNDFPLGNPRSPLRHQLDAHAHAVLHQHSLWVEDDRPSPLTGRRATHFSRDNFIELAPYAGLLLNPESIFAASLIDPRLRRVLKAIAASYDAAGRLLGWETDQTLHAVLLGVLPILGEMAEVAGIGALVGGLVGAVAGFGFGDEVTIPGGAIAGADIALTLFGLYGLAKMLREGGIHLEEFLRLATEASDLAFFAGENQMLHFSYEQDMRDATNLFAAAIGELWYVLLQAIVAYILKRAAELAGPAALESASKLTARSEALQAAIKDAQGYTSKLGPGFSSWLDKNFEKIRKSVEDHQRSRQLGDEGGGEAAATDLKQHPSPPGAARTTKGRYPDFNPKESNTNCGACSDAVDNYVAGKGFKPADHGPPNWPANVKSWDFLASPESIENQLKSSGNGSRGIAYVADDAGNAHVFHVRNEGGAIIAVDGQTGMEGSIPDVAEHAGYIGTNLKWGWGQTYP